MARSANDLRAAVVAKAVGELGTLTRSYYKSPYGEQDNWRSPWLWGGDWQGMYCNRFLSWSVDQVMGAEAGRAAVGMQSHSPLPVGFAATWLQREWFMANGRHVGFSNSQPGDYYLFKLPGRPTNPTNHVGMFVKWHIPGKIAVVIEGNLRRPGSWDNATIGVHYHYRDITYVVGVYRPDWQAAADVWNENNPDPTDEDEMTPEQEQRILDRIDKMRAERTNAHVKTYAMLEAIESTQGTHTRQMNTVGRVAAEARDKIPTVAEIVKGFMTHITHGFSVDWWLRQGLVLDKTHRQYPADPGSLADLAIRTAEAATGESVEVYDGTQKRAPRSEHHAGSTPE